MSRTSRKTELCRRALEQIFAAGGLLACSVICILGQTPAVSGNARQMAFLQLRYEVRMGEPTRIAAPADTLDFLLHARTRSASVEGMEASGLVIAPNETGDQIVLAASQRATPGEYTVTISAISETGEQRQATLDVNVMPRVTVPSGSKRRPVVLLNGWQNGFSNTCPVATTNATTFGNLAPYLVQDGVPVVYLFDNCLEDPSATIEVLGNDLGKYLNTIKYDDGTQVPQIDLVAFSLGGLIARSYLAGLQPSGELTPPTPTLVGKLVLIATPNFGSFVAGNYATQLTVGTQGGELVPGSEFLWNLANWNQRTDDLRGVDTIAVIGNAGTYLATASSTTGNGNASDGIVSVTSASLGFVSQEDSVTRIVPYCHIDPAAFTNTNFGSFQCNAAGIANVTSSSHLTGQIVRSFLAGTTDWKSIGSTPSKDPYLSKYGGSFFGLVNTNDSYVSDLNQVAWGQVQLQNGGWANTIFYKDLASGTGILEPTSQSLGRINCGSYAQTFGYFSAARCKQNTTIISIGPLLSAPGRVVGTGSITIKGADFGLACTGCKVVATPAGSTTGQNLQVTSWTNTSITATLPATLNGLLTITVIAVPGRDAMTIMSVAASGPTIAVTPASLQFTYAAGGAVPAAQTIQISNSGTGTLAWNAAVSTPASWLSVSPVSGTAPSSLSASVSPSALSVGSYSGTIQITSAGASNTPLSIPVTLTVTAAAPSLAVTPPALTFNYTAGGSLPPAQTVSITNASAGTLSWTASTMDYWIAASPASGSAPATLSITVNPANLAAGTYMSAVRIAAEGATGSPASITITLVVQGTQAVPSITSAANAGSFQPGVAAGTWLSIFGTNLSTATYTWQNSDFVNGMLPTSLEGVSVTINGVPAYVEYISPSQINVLAPDDSKNGAVEIQVTTAQQASNSLTVQKSQYAPAFFTIDNGAHVAALHSDYTLVSALTRMAQPGETILLYGTGFGPTDPPLPTGQVVTTPVALANQVQVTIGGVNAPVLFAGLVGSGLYQINVTVPNLPNGDAVVSAVIGGVSTQTGVSVSVQQ